MHGEIIHFSWHCPFRDEKKEERKKDGRKLEVQQALVRVHDCSPTGQYKIRDDRADWIARHISRWNMEEAYVGKMRSS